MPGTATLTPGVNAPTTPPTAQTNPVAPQTGTLGSAQTGSLYLRTDGSGGTRLYTSTGSGWNAVTGS